MEYFVSCLHGDYDAYRRIKSNMGEYDRLWILGDILDGNSEHPENCIKILNDAYRSRNVEIIMGDHEYFHAMRLFSDDDEEAKETWEDSLVAGDISGEPLIEYLNNLGSAERDDITKKLVSLECSEIIKVGDKFFYICHGSPSLRANIKGGNIAWQYNVVTGYVDFYKNYLTEIACDSRLDEFSEKLGDIKVKDMCVITGHVPTSNLVEDGIRDVMGIAYQNNVFCINEGYTPDTGGSKVRKILGVDAAGFVIREF